MARKAKITIPEIAGLLALARGNRMKAKWSRDAEKSPAKDPRDQYDAGVHADALEKSADEAEDHAAENATFILGIETILLGMRNSKFTSAHRTLAIRELEAASDRLRREIGD